MNEATITIYEKGRVLVTENGRTVNVRDRDHVEVVTVGIQGPPGAGSTVVQFPFAYGDATPEFVISITADKLVTRVSLFLEQAFNGVGAALSVGSLLDPDALLAITDNDPASIDVFHVSPNRSFGTDTSLFLFITPGVGASAGRGMVNIEIEQ